MTKLLLTSIVLLSFTASFGQDYVITIRSDTLRGDVKVLSYDLLDRVQIAVGRKKTTYTALQVRRAVVKGDEFAPVKYENGIRMMRIIQSGILSLYEYHGPQQGGYDTKVLQKVGRNSIEVPNMGFKKIVGELVKECPDVSEKIDNGKVNRTDINQIVAEYNTCIEARNQQKMEAAMPKQSTPAGDLVEKLKTKVRESDLQNKSDVNDLLNSISERLKKNEPVPSYMKEGLRGYLGSREDLKAEMEQLLTLLQN
ncbi:MAG TPA: hypothetical protein VF473_08510 [Cyclobacteriaceae bacterium]